MQLGSQWCCRVKACLAPVPPPVGPEAGVDAASDADAGDAAPDAQASCASTADFCGSPFVGVENGQCCYLVLSPPTCCGRPFLVDGERRLAPVAHGTDWTASGARSTPRLSRETRTALASRWLADARLEHASIASFARFTLELLALGAPPELVAGAQQAALDEVRHARDCFALASRYAGEPLGPGALDVSSAVAPRSLADCAARAAAEGCVAETLSALVADAQLARARDARVCRTLRRIVRDEARHAELAWQFLRWALETGGEPVRLAVADAFERARREVESACSEAAEPVNRDVWHAHGRLTSAEEAECRLAALADVVAPSLRALLRAR